MAAMTGRAAVNVFRDFGSHFRSSSWRPHYVRWERHARVQFDHPWLVRAKVEVHSGSRAFASVHFSSPSRRRASPEGELGFARLRRALEGLGYELRVEPQLPMVLFLKQFRPTGPLLIAVREEVESQLWPEERRRRRHGKGEGGIAGAMLQFASAPSWSPSSCGWSRRLRLDDGTDVILALLLHQQGRGGRLHPDATVLLFPPGSADRQQLRKLAALIRAAGYQGKLETARPAGGEPFLFAHYSNARLARGDMAAERARLDELADAMRLVA